MAFKHYRSSEAQELHRKATVEQANFDEEMRSAHLDPLGFWALSIGGSRHKQYSIDGMFEEACRLERDFRRRDLRARLPIVGGLIGKILYG